MIDHPKLPSELCLNKYGRTIAHHTSWMSQLTYVIPFLMILAKLSHRPCLFNIILDMRDFERRKLEEAGSHVLGYRLKSSPNRFPSN